MNRPSIADYARIASVPPAVAAVCCALALLFEGWRSMVTLSPFIMGFAMACAIAIAGDIDRSASDWRLKRAAYLLVAAWAVLWGCVTWGYFVVWPKL